MFQCLILIKTLRRSDSEPYFLSGFNLKLNCLSDYLLTPYDFALLKNLPVTQVNLNALDLTQSNIKDFGKSMKQMIIRNIYFDKALLHNQHLKVVFDKFGPRVIYKQLIRQNGGMDAISTLFGKNQKVNKRILPLHLIYSQLLLTPK